MRSVASTQTFTDRLLEISKFFDGTDAVHQTMKNVTAAFAGAGVPYAIVGGMAVTPTGTAEQPKMSIFSSPPPAGRRCKKW